LEAAQPVDEEDALAEEPSPLGFNENIARERKREYKIDL